MTLLRRFARWFWRRIPHKARHADPVAGFRLVSVKNLPIHETAATPYTLTVTGCAEDWPRTICRRCGRVHEEPQP